MAHSTDDLRAACGETGEPPTSPAPALGIGLETPAVLPDPSAAAGGRLDGEPMARGQAGDGKGLEEALRYRILHGGLHDAYVQVAMDGRLMEFNEVYCRMLGYTPQELYALTYQDLTPERWHPIEEAIVREQILPRGYSDVYEKEYRRKDGTILPVELRTILARDGAGRPSAMWAIVRDIDERKRAELARDEQERRLAAELAAMTRLQALSGRLVQAGDLRPLLQEILSAAAELTGTDKGVIQLLDPHGGTLKIVVHQGLGSRFLDRFAADGCAATCGRARRDLQRSLVEDVCLVPALQGTADLEVFLDEGIRAVQSTPLISRKGDLLGMLSTHFATPHPPTEHELRYVDLLARMAADLVERSRGEEEQRRTNERLAILSSLAGELLVSDEPEEAVASLCRRVMGHLECELYCHYLVDETGDRLRLRDLAGIPEGEAERIRCLGSLEAQDDGGLAGLEPDRSMGDPRAEPGAGGGIRAYVCLPLRAQDGRLLGTVSFGSSLRDCFDEHDLALLRTVADQVAIALERARTIRDLQSANEALRRREEELKEAQRVGRIGSWYWSAETDVMTGSEELLRICGLDPASQRLPRFRDQRGRCYPAEEWDRIDCAMRNTLETGLGYELDLQAIRDGSTVWVTMRGAVARDAQGRIQGLHGTVQDITERKRAEAELQSARLGAETRGRRLEAVLHALPVGVVLTDAQGGVVLSNGRDEEIWGRRPPTLGVEDYAQYQAWWPDSGEPVAPQDWASARAVLKGETVVGQILEIQRSDGARRYVHNSAVPVRDGDGCVIGSAVAIQDITELRRAEMALRDADRRKDEFLAMLAHELRNPLTPIRTGVELLQMAREDAATADRVIAMMKRQLDHLVRLVDDLLDVSRITRGKIELRPQRVDLGAIVAQAIESSQPFVDAGQHALEVSVPSEPLPLEADPVRLAQVFANLLHNAAKYTPPGGRIRLAACREKGKAVVRVRDTGQGIGAEALPLIFDLFAQADRSIESSMGGLGIGLFLVRSLVDLHGGRIEANSDGPGRGSEFVVSLPLADTTGDTARPPMRS